MVFKPGGERVHHLPLIHTFNVGSGSRAALLTGHQAYDCATSWWSRPGPRPEKERGRTLEPSLPERYSASAKC
jgi:hypothetical protein